MDDPKCNKCGASVDTGLMAVFCSRNDCEFMPEEGLPPEFQEWRDQVQRKRIQSHRLWMAVALTSAALIMAWMFFG